MVKAPAAWLLFTALLAASDVRLEIPGQLAPGVPTTGLVVVSDAPTQVRQVEFPDLPGVEWTLAGGSTLLNSTINGVTTRSERIQINITAHQPGELVISGLAVTLHDGTRLTALPRTVRVAAGEADLTGDAQFSVRFSPASAWVGQPVTMEFQAALRSQAIRIESPGIAPPSQATVLAESEPEVDSLLASDGSRWRTETTRWTLLFTAPGTIEVRGQQEYYHCRRDLFDRWVAVGSPRRVALKPVTLTVREVPSEGRPADWAGVVGELTLTATLDRARIAVGEGARLAVTVHGSQAGQVGRPLLPPIEGVRAYPRSDDPIGDADQRTFTWDLVPAAAGRYTIPPPSVPWFDPVNERFSRAESQPLTLDVLPGRSQGLSVAGGAAPTQAAPPMMALPLPLRGQGGSVTAPLFVALAFLIALLLGAGLGWTSTRTISIVRDRHRGRALAMALRQQDLSAAAAALQALRPALLSPAQQQAAQRLDERLAAARFGGDALGDVTTELAELGSIA